MTPKYIPKYISRRILGFVLGIAAFAIPIAAAAVQAESTSGQPTVQKQQAKVKKSDQYHSAGERIFAQNCSRCHAAPDGFPPSISGTVLRHMRVRAQLSAHDEQELLRFLNP